MPTKKTSKTKKAVKAVKETVKGEGFTLEISVNGQTFKASAPTLNEALQEFVESPVYTEFVKTKIVLHYARGGNKRLRIMPLRQGRIILRNISRDPGDLKFLADKLTHELG